MENKTSKSADKPEDPKDVQKKKEEHFYDRWKDPGKNKMGNDITGDMKIANSNGDLEGGQDKRWHMKDDEQE